MNLLTKLEREFGEDIFSRDERGDVLETISTGSLSLDVSTGVGGIPRGRITVIYGAESSGKTSICLETVGSALRKGIKVLYVDLEQTLDYSYAENVIGEFNPDDLIIAQPDSAETGLKIVESFVNGDEKLGLVGGDCGLIIVDSVGAFISEKEKKKDLDESTYAAAADLLTKFLKRNAFKIRTNNIAFIFVNQVRDKIGSFFGGYNIPGGHALKHYSSIMIMMSKISEIKNKENVVLGVNIKFVIKKNKVAPPFRSWDELPIVFGYGVDYYRDVIRFAKMLGVLKMRGAFYIFEEENIGQGVDKTIKFLKNKDNNEMLNKIVDKCYSIVK